MMVPIAASRGDRTLVRFPSEAPVNRLCTPTLALLILFQTTTAPAQPTAPPATTPAEVKAAFLKLLDRPKVPLDVKADTPQPGTAGLVTEHLTFASERKADGTIERVPVLVVRPASAAGRRPAVIALHGTGGSKEGTRSWLNDLAQRGFVAVAIDARYHGERSGGSKGADAYNKAITRAWQAKSDEAQEHPFYYDTCWDLWRTVDYLETRDDVDPKRIGMIGFSMGGIETWLAASVDDRVAVAIPAIAVQSFRWSLENGQWQGRARTIGAAHKAAAKDLGEPEVNAKVCRALWGKVIPGILGPFDCPSLIRLFAGRPLLILNGDRDPNCPIDGANLAIAAAEAAFKDAGASDRLKVNVAKGVGHSVTPEQRVEALDWLVRWLKP
jgi:dienelactone hydrolase